MARLYVVPFAAYLVGATIVSQMPSVYPVAYGVMIAVVIAVTLYLMRGKKVIVPHWRVGEAVVVGLVGIALWIGLCELDLESTVAGYLPESLRPLDRVAYNPFEELSHPLAVAGFLVVRLIGLVAVVPLVEELFWRGFLSRWLTSPEWEEIPLGQFSVKSFCIVVALFTLAHPEWFAAAVYCTLLNGLLYWKKDLWLCVVAHAVSNLALAVYVLATGAWWLW